MKREREKDKEKKVQKEREERNKRSRPYSEVIKNTIKESQLKAKSFWDLNTVT